MPRIISGAAGSLTLNVPAHGTRPTSDRVREALFSALEARDALDRARVLDLYAGSGSLGLEALSRGADTVVLVERDHTAAKVASDNARRVAEASDVAPTQVRVVEANVDSYLARAEAESVDLVFIDPPYELPNADLERTLSALAPACLPDALVIVERSSRSAELEWPEAFEVLSHKKYGETELWWARAN
ncbi:MAG TPA: 16S rRNA (guanine(966)-N(2))-methyltransferase RsmD [Microbacteriaceae bacterium]|nr:16S rRNA (guanine(966)-N(2))-methyltransferase RsmD [Microbacteriaceae bacterium]